MAQKVGTSYKKRRPRIIEKAADDAGTGSCSDTELDLEFGISKSARLFKDGTAYERYVIADDDISRVPLTSETIVVTSNKGARHAIEKWGSLIQIFGNIKNVECPCGAICKKLSLERPNEERLNFLGYATTPGTFYYYNTDNGIDYNMRLERVAESMTNPTNPITLPGPLVNHFSMGTWWYEHSTQARKYGMYGWQNVDKNCEKQNGDSNCWTENPGGNQRYDL